MVDEKTLGEHRPATKGSVVQRPQRGWERITADTPTDSQARTTFRIDAPSPSQEVLARHDADLVEEPDADEQASHIICF